MSINAQVVLFSSPKQVLRVDVLAEILISLLKVAACIKDTVARSFQAIGFSMKHDISEMTKGEELLLYWVRLVVTTRCDLRKSPMLSVNCLHAFTKSDVSNLQVKLNTFCVILKFKLKDTDRPRSKVRQLFEGKPFQQIWGNVFQEVGKWFALELPFQRYLLRNIADIQILVSLGMPCVKIFLVFVQPDLRDALVISDKVPLLNSTC